MKYLYENMIFLIEIIRFLINKKKHMFRNPLEKGEKDIFNHAFEESFFDDREKYFVVIVFFDYILRAEDFLKTIQYFSDGIGCSFDYLGCTLASEFDSKEDEDYFENGALFFWNEEDVWIDDEMFIQCIELAGDIYFENNHSEGEKAIFNQSLQKMKDKRK